MQIDKETVLSFLREQGDKDRVERAERELPDRVDTDEDRSLLERFGIDPGDLLGKLTGGRDIPGF